MPFYLPENPDYTILDSLRDSVHFVLEASLTTYRGRACAKSSFLDPYGNIMHWHDFGDLEGPGWAANSIGGALHLLRFAKYERRQDQKVLTGKQAPIERENFSVEQVALSLIDHTLEDGFVDWSTGFIYPYRDTARDELCLNFKHNNDWFCPGSMARVAWQMLRVSDFVGPERADALRRAANAWYGWFSEHVRPAPNGWIPRRCTKDGAPYTQSAEGGPDPFFANSGDGYFVLDLMCELTARGIRDCSAELECKCILVKEHGGFFASINHDTYDANESVAYAVAFRTLLRAGKLLGREDFIQFAFDRCLAGLDRFKMHEDRNGVATQGLLWMEESWDTAYLWENAEAAAAYVDAFAHTGDSKYIVDALTILRAAAKHHHGPYGFLTEGVDWNNHVGQQHHIGGALYGDIQYTEPLLNNLHIAEATLEILERFPETVWL